MRIKTVFGKQQNMFLSHNVLCVMDDMSWGQRGSFLTHDEGWETENHYYWSLPGYANASVFIHVFYYWSLPGYASVLSHVLCGTQVEWLPCFSVPSFLLPSQFHFFQGAVLAGTLAKEKHCECLCETNKRQINKLMKKARSLLPAHIYTLTHAYTVNYTVEEISTISLVLWSMFHFSTLPQEREARSE